MIAMNNAQTVPHSSPDKPDLDWSQVRETVRMLNVAIAQIERTMLEGDESVNTLTNSFTDMVSNAQIIAAAAEKLPESEEKRVIIDNYQAIADRIQLAIVAFQFYDRLAQRLSHVTNSLAALSELVDTPERLYNPYEWLGLQQKIKSKYTIEADRAMFEAILNGSTVEEALALSRQQQQGTQDDIELF